MGAGDRRRMLEETVAQNRGAHRETRSQELFDELIAELLAENEITLGCCAAFLHGLRIAGHEGAAFYVLTGLAVELSKGGHLDAPLARLRRHVETFGGMPAGE